MQLLNDILDEHYLPEDKKELVLLLERYDIFSTLEKSIALLRQHLVQQIGQNPKAPLTALSTLSSSSLISINNKVIQIDDSQEKRRVQTSVAQLALRILLAIIRQFPDEAKTILSTVSTSLSDTSELMDYNFEDIRRLMMLGDIQHLFNTVSGVQQASEIAPRTPLTLPFLQWTDMAPLGTLTYELHERKWIKSRKAFEDLFENQDANFRLHFDFGKKAHLAYLLYRLKKEKYIAQNGSKGYFSIVESYVVDFSGKPLTKNSLKKLSSKINNEEWDYSNAINEIGEIMGKLKKAAQGLSGDYSGTIRNSPLMEGKA